MYKMNPNFCPQLIKQLHSKIIIYIKKERMINYSPLPGLPTKNGKIINRKKIRGKPVTKSDDTNRSGLVLLVNVNK